MGPIEQPINENDATLAYLRAHNQRKGIGIAKRAIQAELKGPFREHSQDLQSGLLAAIAILDNLIGEVDADKILP